MGKPKIFKYNFTGVAIASFKKRRGHRVRLSFRLAPASTCVGLERYTSHSRFTAKQDHPNSNLLALLSLQRDVANTSSTFVGSPEVSIASGERRTFLHLPDLRSRYPSIHFTVSSFKVLEDWDLHALPGLVLPFTLSLRSKTSSQE